MAFPNAANEARRPAVVRCGLMKGAGGVRSAGGGRFRLGDMPATASRRRARQDTRHRGRAGGRSSTNSPFPVCVSVRVLGCAAAGLGVCSGLSLLLLLLLLFYLKSGVFWGFVVYRKNRLASCDVIAPCAFRRAHWLGPCGPWRVYGPPVSSHTYRNNL